MLVRSTDGRIFLYINCDKYIGTEIGPNSYCVGLVDSYKDTVVEEPKSSLPIPLPAP
ncbi:MAG TPA: hypothetical protein VJH92_04540 [Candidatus Nanoarchaeia archaeon]|nr:hypothetical protein [Candidatus Nanoarchaeia archaeon]